MGKRQIASIATLCSLVFTFLVVPTPESADAAISSRCTITNSVEEPILDSDCTFFPFARGYASFDSCEYRSYGIEIASSNDGIYRVEIETANGLGFQAQPQISMTIDVQENCNKGYGDPYYLLEAFVVSEDGKHTQLTRTGVRSDWDLPRSIFLPGYCGFRSCGESSHDFSGTLPSEGKYSIHVYSAFVESGLSDGIDNKVVVFPSVIEYRASTTAPTAISWGVSWA